MRKSLLNSYQLEQLKLRRITYIEKTLLQDHSYFFSPKIPNPLIGPFLENGNFFSDEYERMNLYTSHNEESDEDSHTEDSNILDELFKELQLGSGGLNWRIQWFSYFINNSYKKNNNKKNTNFIIIYKLWGNPSYLFILFIIKKIKNNIIFWNLKIIN